MNNNNMINLDNFDDYFKTIYKGHYKLITPSDLVFEENVKMNCYYCGKYGNNWRCPPNLPDVDFKRMVLEYDKGIFVWNEYEIKDCSDYDKIRNDSSVILHRALLKIEKWLWDNNSSTAISFGAGSCKLCKDGCGKERCNNPYMSRSPLEAAGVNVVKSAKKYGIDITFPTNDMFIRLGLVLFQEV